MSWFSRLLKPGWVREAERLENSSKEVESFVAPSRVAKSRAGARGAPLPKGDPSEVFMARAGGQVESEANDRARDVEAMIHLDSLALRAAMAYQDAAERAGIRLMPAPKAAGHGSRATNRARRAAEEFLAGICGPQGESWEDLWSGTVGQLALHSNSVSEVIWDANAASGPANEQAMLERAAREPLLRNVNLVKRQCSPETAWSWGLARRLKYRPNDAWRAAAALARATDSSTKQRGLLRVAAALAPPSFRGSDPRIALLAEAEGRRSGESAEAAPDPDGMIANMVLLPWPSMHLVLSDGESDGLPAGWPMFWVHNLPDGTAVVFGLEEAHHVHRWRIAGERYGSPAMEAAAGPNGDLRSLRTIESLDGQQAQADVFPMRIVNFGSELNPVRNDSQMSKYQSDLEGLQSTGWLVGNGLVSGQVLGSEGQALDLRPKLQWWMQRFIISTGLSPLRFGIGLEETNRATADIVTHVENVSIAAVAWRAATALERGPVAVAAGEAGDPAAAPALEVGDIDPLVADRRVETADARFVKGVITREEARAMSGLPMKPPKGQTWVENTKTVPDGRPAEPGKKGRPTPRDEKRRGGGGASLEVIK